MPVRFVIITTTILAGQSLSGVVNASIGAPVFLHMPKDWNSAVLSFQVSPSGNDDTFNDLFNADGRELTYNVAAGTSVRIDPIWSPVTYFKVRSGARNNPVPQDEDRLITFVVDTAAVA
jgi:hypothetical protein